MDAATESLMISVHPRLFGPLLEIPHRDQRPTHIARACLCLNMQPDDVVTLVHTEPEGYVFLSHCHLKETNCHNGLCNSRHERPFAVPSHIRVSKSPLAHCRRTAGAESSAMPEGEKLLALLISNPAILTAFPEMGLSQSRVLFPEMVAQRGIGAVFTYLEYILRCYETFVPSATESLTEMCFKAILTHFCTDFLRLLMQSMLHEATGKTEVPFAKLAQIVASAIDSLPPIACFFVKLAKRMQKEYVPGQPSAGKDSFGRVSWNHVQHPTPPRTSVKQPLLSLDPNRYFDAMLVHSVVHAVLYCIPLSAKPSFPIRQGAVRSRVLEQLSTDHIAHTMRSIIAKICDRNISDSVEQVPFAQRTLTGPNALFEKAECISTIENHLRRYLKQIFYKTLEVLSEKELLALSRGHLYCVTDLHSSKVIARSSASLPYRYIRSLSHVELHEKRISTSNNALGTSVGSTDDGIWVHTFANASLPPQPKLNVVALNEPPIFVDDENRLWCVEKQKGEGTSAEGAKPEAFFEALCVRQLVASGEGERCRVTCDQLLGSLCRAPFRRFAMIRSFRVRITGGVVVLARRGETLCIERYFFNERDK